MKFSGKIDNLYYCNGNLKFADALYAALLHDNVFIRRKNWGKTLYAQFKNTDMQEIMMSLINIDSNNNYEINVVSHWNTQISIENAYANNWEIYKVS